MSTQLTTHQVALVLGISEASLKRWCDRGLLPATRTAGGHRRVPVHGIFDFVRRRGMPLARPEVIGLPIDAGRGHAVVARGTADLRRALETGDEESFRRLAFDPWIAGTPLVDVLEGGVVPALLGLGQDARHGRAAIEADRRAIDICVRFLREIRGLLPPPAEDAPLAIGGAPEGDPYLLPSAMVETVLLGAGWRTRVLGCDTPPGAFEEALARAAPDLVWLSISAAPDRERLVRAWGRIHALAEACGAWTILGGRALDAELRARMPASLSSGGLRGLATLPLTRRRSLQSA